jgi:hypothetical protein
MIRAPWAYLCGASTLVILPAKVYLADHLLCRSTIVSIGWYAYKMPPVFPMSSLLVVTTIYVKLCLTITAPVIEADAFE